MRPYVDALGVVAKAAGSSGAVLGPRVKAVRMLVSVQVAKANGSSAMMVGGR